MEVQTIDATVLKSWLENNEVVLIDVREPEEYQEANIKESVLIPLGTLNPKELPSSENKKLVIHCRSGMRSHTACERILEVYPELEIYNASGGILAWIEHGFAVQQGT